MSLDRERNQPYPFEKECFDSPLQTWENWLEQKGGGEIVENLIQKGPSAYKVRIEDRRQVIEIGDFLKHPSAPALARFLALIEKNLDLELSQLEKERFPLHQQIQASFAYLSGEKRQNVIDNFGIQSSHLSKAKKRTLASASVIMEALNWGEIKEKQRLERESFWRHWLDQREPMVSKLKDHNQLEKVGKQRYRARLDKIGKVRGLFQMVTDQGWPLILARIEEEEQINCRIKGKEFKEKKFRLEMEVFLIYLNRGETSDFVMKNLKISSEGMKGVISLISVHFFNLFKNLLKEHKEGLLPLTLRESKASPPNRVWDEEEMTLIWRQEKQQIRFSPEKRTMTIGFLVLGEPIEINLSLTSQAFALALSLCQNPTVSRNNQRKFQTALGELDSKLRSTRMPELIHYVLESDGRNRQGFYELRPLTEAVRNRFFDKLTRPQD